MTISVFELFKIGIGPSSSHTVGPMLAALRFVKGLKEYGLLPRVCSVKVELFGSLGATGKGHGTDVAMMLGLQGEEPETVDPESVTARIAQVRSSGKLALLGNHEIDFLDQKHLVMHRRKTLPYHSNGMQFFAYDELGETIHQRTYYSVGGGFVVDETSAESDQLVKDKTILPYPFKSCEELLAQCARNDLSISRIAMENEKMWRSEEEVRAKLLNIWKVMEDCVDRGCSKEGVLPGRLKLRRRAALLCKNLKSRPEASLRDPLTILDWVNLYALAVTEENASGGRVVTAPTNGAAGVIPAVLHYYKRFCHGADDEGIVKFLLTAGMIGILYIENASISGAEVGCQGEMGSACSMAAGALTEVMGGTPSQVENAAEIAMEHNLGLTCDPVGGLVQVPCIERNAMAAVKAINAARMALQGDGTHFVSLDKVIRTMRDTGADMKTKYKETARGGLAVNVIEC